MSTKQDNPELNQESAVETLREALVFFDNAKSSGDADAVGTDHWDWLEKAARDGISTPKCPKCQSAPGTYRELATTSYRFELEGNKFIEASKDIGGSQVGFVYDGKKIDCELDDIEHTGKVLANCGSCGHEWILRKFKSIDELIALHGVS
tara:strand:- start:50 stop:499 length:450 start_codon:yes stop_codon:yes gene_type:complete